MLSPIFLPGDTCSLSNLNVLDDSCGEDNSQEMTLLLLPMLSAAAAYAQNPCIITNDKGHYDLTSLTAKLVIHMYVDTKNISDSLTGKTTKLKRMV